MKLNELTSVLHTEKVTGDDTVTISDIASDSRKVTEGTLFVAIKGVTVDGHNYINKAVTQGAAAIVCEHMPDGLTQGVAIVVVPDTVDALGRLLNVWHGNPSERLMLVGVTGTNGKTTIATLLYELFSRLGHKAGLLSTNCNYIDGDALPSTHTTPDPVALYSLVAQMADAGCEYVFMEVSSHAIDQQRISGLTFRGGIFTNLTRDHLDYHQTVENYLKAKKTFFDRLPATAFALTNVDDKSGNVMLQNTAAICRTYSLQKMADFRGRITELNVDGAGLTINGTAVQVHFTGRFNAYNLLAVYGAALLLGKRPNETLLALSALRPVAGRFETFVSPQGYTAIVDYAHTPDALANVLDAIRIVVRRKIRIITVVGAGGDRDKGKRPLMAQVAYIKSGLLILTSDNPRTENPAAILRDMLDGLDVYDRRRTLCIVDREQAIRTATTLARKGDIILIAGKGHETYQEIGGVKHPFDDREILKQIFATPS
ncbi:MAG: UDP-N-acetylmuramoyl-L-alanyl-D-glutamate--2,6-diaminopimelate ligase [Tannerella sp.]|jgi:UDP-N-acetylmuramoyl-L-alanyl-D-glutamate--2,6-diaminopimelate ligase|nr:UDP-N-acetylmuramoyl-L-alanyl-D-glutamate--2,6-diaminopimelate ligase [Tannerella sp.]